MNDMFSDEMYVVCIEFDADDDPVKPGEGCLWFWNGRQWIGDGEYAATFATRQSALHAIERVSRAWDRAARRNVFISKLSELRK